MSITLSVYGKTLLQGALQSKDNLAMPTLTLQFKGSVVKEYQLHQDRTLTIGRKESNDVVIANLGVSGSHARIDSVADQFTLTDVGSTNGTFVNKELITSKILKDKDIVLVGKHELIFDCSDLDLSGFENDNVEETLHLDTAEYRDLTEKAKKEAEENK